MKNVLMTLILLISFAPSFVFAEDLTSTNFKINNATVNSGGEVSLSGTGNFKLLDTIGDFSGDPRVYSSSYKASIGEVELFTASIPVIACFETTTNGSSSCTTGPAYLNTGGMVRVCGYTGCYDRARFEIDVQGNPADTLYAIQISEDNFASDIRVIDGITLKPKDAEKTIDDFKTKVGWETPSVNILGLDSETEYKIRAIALHGDFTETSPGPSKTATTAKPTITFDIDIAGTGGAAQESDPPFSISFSNGSTLIQTGPTRTASNLIWLDAQTNGSAGFALLVKGENGGLYSSSVPYTIDTVTDDLDARTEGWGLQKYTTTQQYENGGGNGELGTVTTHSDYSGSVNNVGSVDPTFKKIYESDKPVISGRMSAYLKARASSSASPADDYTETLTFVIVPRY